MWRDPEERTEDPWIVERRTLCALEGDSVAAAAHLQRFGGGPEVGDTLRNSARIRWALCWPGCHEAAVALLAAARQCMREWGSTSQCATMALPAPGFVGVPDVWPHVAGALRAAGFRPEPGEHLREALWGGWLRAERVTSPERASDPRTAVPAEGLSLSRAVGRWWRGTDLRAVAEGKEIGCCAVRTDLTNGGEVPALAGWAQIADFEVNEAWRNRGIGTWLLRRAVDWMHLAGCDRVLLAVSEDAEGQRAGHLYQRFGWDVLAVTERAWVVDAP